MKPRIEKINERVDSLEPKTANTRTNTRKALCAGLVSGLTEDEQVSLARVIRDLEKENINPENFEAWLSTRPQDQQTVAKRILSAPKEAKRQEARSTKTET